MSGTIKVKKGLDISLKGKAELYEGGKCESEVYAIYPDDFVGLTPKVVVKPGDKVWAGTPLMIDKNREEVCIVSPVSGEIVAVNRGDRRKVINVEIRKDGEKKFVNFGVANPQELSAEEIKQKMISAGLFAFIRQRPYDVVADPRISPRDIFVSCFDTAPLAPSVEYILRGEEENFEAGLVALSKLTTGKLYVSIKEGADYVPKHGEVYTFSGKHPTGNVGTQIAYISPINKGDVVWTMSALEVLFIGRLFNEGRVNFKRKVAVTGSEIIKPCYVETILGASIKELLKGNVVMGKNLRYISGNVLTGKNVGREGYLSAFASQVSVIPEGNDRHEFLGGITLGMRKLSNSRLFPAGFGQRGEYDVDARMNGSERAMIMSGEYDKMFPMDIYPEYLLKAIMAFDINKMENLGIYEVAPEDFALCEFVDTSKIEIQHIVREGLDRLRKEMN
ncbi:MAG TPA: NADH:ubiquinone reductase (Na(+)-transporting) subunit A [Porphyromonadaceae bacterium]|nr:NADH:ubiquinone reductase (Na(+)-transporting) subunit A [Porphyromonadaceae bacterium]